MILGVSTRVDNKDSISFSLSAFVTGYSPTFSGKQGKKLTKFIPLYIPFNALHPCHGSPTACISCVLGSCIVSMQPTELKPSALPIAKHQPSGLILSVKNALPVMLHNSFCFSFGNLCSKRKSTPEDAFSNVSHPNRRASVLYCKNLFFIS